MTTHDPAAAGYDVLWSPFPGFQQVALANGADEALIGGAAGPGKTDCIIFFPLRWGHQPWLRALILRRHLEDLGEIEDRLAAVIPRMFPGAVFNSIKKRWLLPAGGWIRFGYCDRWKHVQRYMGQQYTYIGWDEVGEVPEERWVTRLMSRLRSKDPDGARHCFFRGSANPGGEGHAWLKRRYVLPCGKDGARVHFVTERNPLTGQMVTRSVAFIPGRLKDNPILFNDAKYVARLLALPERDQKALLEGDWDAAGGLAFPELDKKRHWIPAIPNPPSHWMLWGGYDWGFAHPGALVILAQDDMGRVLVIDTVWHRRLLPDAIAELVAERWDVTRLQLIYGGSDLRAEGGGRSDHTPSIEEKLQAHGWPIAQANQARVAGYQHVYDLHAWQGRGEGGRDQQPLLYFCETEGNKRLWDQLEELVTDPDDPNDVLKVDADADGKGGDDGYDAFRYGIATHLPAPTKAPAKARSAFDPSLMAEHAAAIRRHTSSGTETATHEQLDLSHLDNAWEVM